MYKNNLEEMKRFFYYYYSTKKTDYVAELGVHSRCEMPCEIDHKYYWSNIAFKENLPYKKNKSAIGAFGCSITFGDGLKEEDTWPFHIENRIGIKTLNFGLSAGGIDSVYLNLINSRQEYEFSKVILLLPNFERKIARLQVENLYFKWPTTPNNTKFKKLLPKPIGADLPIDKPMLDKTHNKTVESIIKDKNNSYSKKIISKIHKFCSKNYKNFFISSWDKETYDFCKKKFQKKNLMPFYELDGPRSNDGWHPTKIQNLRFAESILTYLK